MKDFYADVDNLLLFRPLENAGESNALVLTYDTLEEFCYLFDSDKTVEIWRTHEKKDGQVKATYYQGALTAIVYNRVAMQSIAFTLGNAPARTGTIIIEPTHLAALKHGYRDPDDLADAIALKLAKAFQDLAGG